MCRQMAAFYPHQEMCAETVEGYMLEFERMAVKQGIHRLEGAFLALRSKPGQKFFPHPTEVAEEIEEQIEAEQEERRNQLLDDRAKRERQADIETFWNDILPDRMQRFGWTEEEVLRRFPSFRHTKPATLPAARAESCNVVTMPARDRKSAAAGDRNDAA
jgi:hypothetical protein